MKTRTRAVICFLSAMAISLVSMEANAWDDVCWTPHEDYFDERREELDYEYSWLNVNSVRTIYFIGKPAYALVMQSDDLAFDVVTSLGSSLAASVTTIALDLGTDAALEFLRTALEDPRELAAEIGGRTMERGLSGLNDNYRVYTRGISGLSDAAKLEFRQRQVYVDLMGPAKELYKTARDDETATSADPAVLDNLSALESVLDSTKGLSLLAATMEVAEAIQQAGAGLETYPPYTEYQQAVAAVHEANGIIPCGSREERLTPTSIVSDEGAKSDIAKVRRTATPDDLPSYCRDWNTSYPEIIASRTPEDVIDCVQAGADPNAWDRYLSPPALHVALQENPDPSLIEVLLEAGADPNVWYGDSPTALHWSIRNEISTAFVAALLRGGADPNVRDSMGETPLHVAATHAADPALVSLLVDAGADLGARRNNVWGQGETPLHIAAAYSDHPAAMVAALLRAGADHQTENDWGQTPLEAAMGRSQDNRRDETVVSLRSAVAPPPECGKQMASAVKTFADMTPQEFLRCADAVGGLSAQVGNRGFTLLHWAAFANDDPAAIHALVEAGGDPNATDGFGRTPLDWAVLATRNPAIVSALLEADVEPGVAVNAAHLAASHRNTPAVLATFLDGGIDPHVENQYGRTLLHSAAHTNGEPAVLEVLLDAGADPFAKDTKGRAPLHLAAWRNTNPDVIATLIEAGTDPDVRDERGRTPMHLLTLGGDWDRRPAVIQALVEAGADVNARSNESDGELTPLHFVTQFFNANPAAIDALIGAGADVNAPDTYGMTALHWAARRNENVAFIQALVEGGANLNAQTNGGSTPMHWAVRGNNLAALAALLDAGADPSLRDQNGRTARDIAEAEDRKADMIAEFQAHSRAADSGESVGERRAD